MRRRKAQARPLEESDPCLLKAMAIWFSVFFMTDRREDAWTLVAFFHKHEHHTSTDRIADPFELIAYLVQPQYKPTKDAMSQDNIMTAAVDIHEAAKQGHVGDAVRIARWARDMNKKGLFIEREVRFVSLSTLLHVEAEQKNWERF